MNNTRPFPYQKEAALQIERFGGRAILALSMGLGKSLTALLWAKWNPDIRPILIVCQATMKLTWAREASTHFGMSSDVLSSNTPRENSYFHTSNIYIISYNLLWAWEKFLIALKPKLIILDECQAIANQRSRQSKFTKKICQGIPHIIGLSGTPLINRPVELYPVLNIIRPDLFPKFRPYGDTFCGARLTPWGWDYSGATQLPKLHKILKRELLIRVLKKDVLEELPNKQRIIVPLPMDNEKEYWTAEKDFLGWLAKQSLERARRASKAEKLTRYGYLKRLAAKLKLRAACKWVEEFLEEFSGKLVIFAEQREILKHLELNMQDTSVCIKGGMTTEAKQLAVDQFQSNNSVRLCLGNIKAAGTGVTLTKARDVAFMEYPWAPAHINQCEERCIGRVNDLHGGRVWFLVAANSIEHSIIRLLQDKQEILDATLDGGKVQGSLDIYDLLEEELQKQ